MRVVALSAAVAFSKSDYVRCIFSVRPAGISVRRPRWSARKASKVRSDDLEVIVCSEQGKAIFATGDRTHENASAGGTSPDARSAICD
jgi:hypothetical protein